MRGFLRRLPIPVTAVVRPPSVSAPDETDVFCNGEHDPISGEPRDSVIARSKHFDVRIASFPLTPGHLLITPRRHLLTGGDVPVAWHWELRRVQRLVVQFQRDAGYGTDTFVREQGSPLVRQAVHHMHIHMLPVAARVVIPEIPGALRVGGMLGVSRFRRGEHGYHYIASGADHRVMGDEGEPVARAEKVLCDALDGVWDDVKKQATKMTAEEAVAPVAELRARWDAWAPRHQKLIRSL